MKKPTTPQSRPQPLPLNEMSIISFYHCALCMKEKPEGISPRDWALLEVGSTDLGLQVWCKRHDCNVIHISFEGQKHLANTSRKKNGGSK